MAEEIKQQENKVKKNKSPASKEVKTTSDNSKVEIKSKIKSDVLATSDNKEVKEVKVEKKTVSEMKTEPEAVQLKKEDIKTEEKKTENKEEKKMEEKKEVKAEKKVIPKKEEAVANGLDIHASQKHCMYLCSFIKGKKIDSAMGDLQEVIKLKKVVPFKGEIPHRSDPGVMSGRYPVAASKLMINVLKALKGNAIVNGLDLDKTRIYFAFANRASRPARSGGRRAKRCHITLKAKEIQNKEEEKR